jgi:hypothetical protein
MFEHASATPHAERAKGGGRMMERVIRPASGRAAVPWAGRIGVALALAAGAYILTWRLLPGAHALVLATLWVVETYLVGFAIAYLTILRPARAQEQAERRGLPRIPVAMPVRYSTEEGEVGIGVLTDINE